MKLRSTQRGRETCPLCRVELAGSIEPEQACRGCGTRYHTDCLAELGGCSTLGCEAQGDRVQRAGGELGAKERERRRELLAREHAERLEQERHRLADLNRLATTDTKAKRSLAWWLGVSWIAVAIGTAIAFAFGFGMLLNDSQGPPMENWILGLAVGVGSWLVASTVAWGFVVVWCGFLVLWLRLARAILRRNLESR